MTCRLDHFLISKSTMLSGQSIEASILPSTGSDHWPICLSMEILGIPLQKPFRFEKFWLSHLDFQENVARWWHNATIDKGTLIYRFQQKLKNLKIWNKTVFHNIFQDKRALECKMEIIQQGIILQGHSEALIQEEQDNNSQLDEHYKQEEILWRQKS